MQTIVITGATSMIGVAVIEAYLKHQVRKIYAVVRPGSSKLYRLPKSGRIEIVECDVEQYFKLPDLISEKCDIFYHMAWNMTADKRNKDIHRQAENIIYTLDAVKAAGNLGCIKFIGAGSQAEYGKLDLDRIGVNSPANPTQPYGIAKYTAGKFAMEEAKRMGISCIWVRIFSVYGKYDNSSSMICSAVNKMKDGRKVSFTEGIQRWDYLYSEDAGEAFYCIGKKAKGQKIYCLGSGEARPLREFIMMMRDSINPDLPLGFGEIPYQEDTVMNLCADITELVMDTGWRPTTPFLEGIARVVRES